MSLQSPRILIVEHDADVADALEALLTEEGYGTSIAPSPSSALQLLAAEPFHLLVCDLFGGDFHAITPVLQAAAPVPVGLMTAWRVDVDEARRRGFAFAIIKPPQTGEIVERVAAALGKALPPESVEAVVARRYFSALTERRWDDLTALCTPDVVYNLASDGPFGRTVEGREAFRRFTEETFKGFAEASFDDVVVFRTPKGMAARYAGSWKNGHGREKLTGSVVFELQGELIRRIGVQLDDERLAALANSSATARPS